ncbi:MAG: glycosyltransferase family 4 protein, partial [Phycisphaerales bacterium]
SLMPGPERTRVGLVCNDLGLSPLEYAGSLAARVRPLVAGASRVVVKTNQMVANDLAVELARDLRAPGRTVALIARGGYWWSRFVEAEHEAESPQARDAVAREARLCRGADLVVGTSREMVQGLIEKHGLDPGAAALIPNYVVVDCASSPVAREPGTVLYAGQLVARKRVDVLVRAAAILAKQSSGFVRMDIVGAGPELGALRGLAESLQAPVRFEPRVPHEELLRRMAGTAVYAQTSALEGHPKTVIEAMATGAPVVVAPSPGLGCVVRDGVSGVVAEPTPEAFAGAIGELLTNDELRVAMGAAAARESIANYGLDSVLKLELAAHESALARAAGRSH